MQRKAVAILFPFALLLAAGCGGKSKKSTVGPPATVTISPSSASLEVGKFISLTAIVKDSAGNTVNDVTVTWSSNKPTVADVTANGAVCAGKWNSLTAPTVCAPGAADVATITATAGTVSSAATVNTHVHIARLEIIPVAGCTSQGQTQQFAARALDANQVDITSTVGALAWTITDTTIGSIDANGLITAKRPGIVQVNASVSGTIGLPTSYVTCPPWTITIGTQGVTPLETSFTLPTGTKTLAATVVDTKGNPISDLPLTYSSSAAGVVGVTTSGLNATVTAGSPGTAGILASCTPPACNPGSRVIYSNVVTVTVPGTTSGKILVTGTTATSVVVIDTTNNTASAPVPLPTITVSGVAKTPVPKSIIVAKDGSKAYIGTDLGVLVFDLSTNTFATSALGIAGNVLAITRSGGTLIVSDNSANAYAIDIGRATSQTFALGNVTAADFSPDDLEAYLVSGTRLTAFAPSFGIVGLPALSSAGSDVRFLARGSVALIAEPGANLEMRATCDNSSLGTVGITPVLLETSVDGTRFFGADNSNIYDVSIDVTAPTVPPLDACVPNVATAPSTKALGTTTTARQLIVAPNTSHVYLLGDSATVYDYTVGSSVTGIPLAGGALATTGGITPDAANVYVGTSAGDVHRVSTSTQTDAQQIPVGLKKADGTAAVPDLVAARPR